MPFRRNLTAGVSAALIAATLTVPINHAEATTAQPRTSYWHGCAYETLCVHFHYLAENTWSWTGYWGCGPFTVPRDAVATWFVNNQTPRTRSTFYYRENKNFTTPPPPSRGPVPTHGAVPLDAYKIRVC
jgi:hypothetical protein